MPTIICHQQLVFSRLDQAQVSSVPGHERHGGC